MMIRIFTVMLALVLTSNAAPLRAELSSADLNLIFGQYKFDKFGLVHEFAENDKQYILSDTLTIQSIGRKTKEVFFSKNYYRWLTDSEYPKFGADITGDGQPDAVVFA